MTVQAVVDGKKMCGRSDCQEQNPQPISQFSKAANTSSGLKSYCKSCVKRMYRSPENLEREKARRKARYEREADIVKARAAEWYKRNRELAISRAAAYQAQNRERVNERFRAYRADGRYRQSDRAHAAKRRAQLATVQAETINLDRLYARDKGLCQLCGERVDRTLRWPHPASESLDHIKPISLGGAHVWINVQLAHLRCNMKKGSRV